MLSNWLHILKLMLKVISFTLKWFLLHCFNKKFGQVIFDWMFSQSLLKHWNPFFAHVISNPYWLNVKEFCWDLLRSLFYYAKHNGRVLSNVLSKQTWRAFNYKLKFCRLYLSFIKWDALDALKRSQIVSLNQSNKIC